jgi:hypothetical protein
MKKRLPEPINRTKAKPRASSKGREGIRPDPIRTSPDAASLPSCDLQIRLSPKPSASLQVGKGASAPLLQQGSTLKASVTVSMLQ